MDYSALSTFRFSADTCIPQAQPKERERVLLDSPAISVMTDLAQVPAETISPETPIAKAEEVMKEFADMDLLDHDALKTATVSRVVGTFKKLKCAHILGVQAATKAGPARIRGVISVTQAERQLGEMILAVTR